MEKVDRPLGPVVVDIAGTSLTDEEVAKFMEKISKALAEQVAAEVR